MFPRDKIRANKSDCKQVDIVLLLNVNCGEGSRIEAAGPSPVISLERAISIIFYEFVIGRETGADTFHAKRK